MKKYIVMFGLTLVMGLFLANNLQAQDGPPWSKVGNWWTLEDANWISVDGRLRAFDRVVTPIILPPPGVLTFDLGAGSANGANLEMFHKNHATRPGELSFVYGGGEGYGIVRYRHYNGTGWFDKMVLDRFGNLEISGLLSSQGAEVVGDLIVDGKITSKEIEVKLDVWPDFVFADDYELMSLYEVENYIQQNRHLPNVPSEAQVLENGVNVGEMTSILLQKVEELTLHIIELNKRIEELEK